MIAREKPWGHSWGPQKKPMGVLWGLVGLKWFFNQKNLQWAQEPLFEQTFGGKINGLRNGLIKLFLTFAIINSMRIELAILYCTSRQSAQYCCKKREAASNGDNFDNNGKRL